MSPEAIDQRMRDVSELWELWQTLKALRVADASPHNHTARANYQRDNP